MERQLGLQIEYEPTDRVPNIDIIAVPGLGARYPWKRDVTTTGERKYVNWLADENMLPSQLPDARILTFHYESRWQSAAPQQTLLDCGTELFQAIRRERARESTQKDKPIIFIGHSLGGIVIEQAIVLAGQCQKAGDCFDLTALVAGFVFLGAPFRGSGSATAGRVFASAAKCLEVATESRVIRALEYSSEVLDSLLQLFSHWLSLYQVPFYCFYEKYPTIYRLFGGLGLIVPKDSACIDSTQRECLYSDHLEIAKYSGPNDPNYVKVYQEIGDLAYKAGLTVCRRR